LQEHAVISIGNRGKKTAEKDASSAEKSPSLTHNEYDEQLNQERKRRLQHKKRVRDGMMIIKSSSEGKRQDMTERDLLESLPVNMS